MKNYSDIVARAKALHAAGALPARVWTLPLICDHLAKAMTGSTGALGPGPARKAAPFIRRTVGRIVVLNFGFIPKGVESPARVVPQADISWEDAVKNLETAIALCREKSIGDHPWLAHPLLGFSDAKTWERFHVIHARHHFGCLRLPKP